MSRPSWQNDVVTTFELKRYCDIENESIRPNQVWPKQKRNSWRLIVMKVKSMGNC